LKAAWLGLMAVAKLDQEKAAELGKNKKKKKKKQRTTENTAGGDAKNERTKDKGKSGGGGSAPRVSGAKLLPQR